MATSPSVAFRFGERTQDPVQMYLSDVLTLPANIAGIPGISVPSGLVDGMPVGFQVLATPLYQEPWVASAYAQGHRLWPDIQAALQRLHPAELIPLRPVPATPMGEGNTESA